MGGSQLRSTPKLPLSVSERSVGSTSSQRSKTHCGAAQSSPMTSAFEDTTAMLAGRERAISRPTEPSLAECRAPFAERFSQPTGTPRSGPAGWRGPCRQWCGQSLSPRLRRQVVCRPAAIRCSTLTSIWPVAVVMPALAFALVAIVCVGLHAYRVIWRREARAQTRAPSACVITRVTTLATET
jgi:hypothetical protein